MDSRFRRVDSLTDNQVMWQVRDGEVEKLGVLFERHHQTLFNFFVRLTGSREFSEDLVQEVFLRMLKYRHTFQPENQFRSWMFQIARNARFDALRKRQREARLNGPETAEELISPEPTPDLSTGRQQEIGLLERALARLPAEKREVLLLSRVQNLKYDEVAEILGCDTGAVKVRVHRALKELRDIFHQLTGEKPYELRTGTRTVSRSSEGRNRARVQVGHRRTPDRLQRVSGGTGQSHCDVGKAGGVAGGTAKPGVGRPLPRPVGGLSPRDEPGETRRLDTGDAAGLAGLPLAA